MYILGLMNKVLLFSLPFFIFPTVVFAAVNVSTTGDSNVTVNQETKGESTTCINGKCTTTGGESKSKVCVNGKCYESDNGNLEVNEGNTQINIKNSNGTNSVSVKSTGNSSTTVNVETDDDEKESSESSKKSREAEEIKQSIFEQIAAFFKNLFSIF